MLGGGGIGGCRMGGGGLVCVYWGGAGGCRIGGGG